MGVQAARVSALVLCVASLCGCLSAYAPAVIVEQTPDGRRELSRVIATALHRDQVTLADDALTATSSLVIERARATDEQGLPLNGRERSAPEKFELYARRDTCELVHVQSGRRWRLRSVKCRLARGDGTS